MISERNANLHLRRVRNDRIENAVTAKWDLRGAERDGIIKKKVRIGLTQQYRQDSY